MGRVISISLLLIIVGYICVVAAFCETFMMPFNQFFDLVWHDNIVFASHGCKLCIAQVLFLEHMTLCEVLSLHLFIVEELCLQFVPQMVTKAQRFTDRDVLYGVLVFRSCSVFDLVFSIYDEDPICVVSNEELPVRSCASDIFKRSKCEESQVAETMVASYCVLDHLVEAIGKLLAAYDKDLGDVDFDDCKIRRIWLLGTTSFPT